MAVNSAFIKAKTRGLDAGDGVGLVGKMRVVFASILQRASAADTADACNH